VRTWQWASPEWSPAREAAIRTDKGRMKSARFRANYCNQWVQSIDGFVDPSVWEAARADELPELPDTGIYVAAECSHDGTAHTIAAAEITPDGLIILRAFHYPDFETIGAQLAIWRAQRRTAAIRVTPAYEKRLPRELTGRFELVGRREAPAATSVLAELLSTDRIVHGGDPVLTAHMLRSKAIRGENGMMLSSVKSAGTVHAARAAMFAAWAAVTAPVPRKRTLARSRPDTLPPC
jgi:hypothetical protein